MEWELLDHNYCKFGCEIRISILKLLTKILSAADLFLRLCQKGI